MSEEKLTWNDEGIERLEYFIAETIANHVEEMTEGWSHEPDRLVNELRCVCCDDAPDFLRMRPTEAGIVMASMMRDRLEKLLVPDGHLWSCPYDAIDRAIEDEEYDQMHKD